MNGTAAGTKLVHSYASLVMSYVEVKTYRKVGKPFHHNFRENIVKK